MPTEVVHTIRASGGDYTSLSAWEAAQQRDLVAVDQIAVAECYNDWASGLSDSVTVGGWTSDATRRVIIRPAAGNGTNGANDHGGIPGAGFRITSTTSFGTTVAMSSVYTRIEGIEARHPTNAGTGFGATAAAVPWQYELDRCIAYDCKAHGTAGGFRVRHGVMTNCLAEAGGLGFAMQANFFGYRAYGCVAANNTLGGFHGTSGTDADNSAPALRNCVAYANTPNYTLVTIYTADTSNNAASDGATTTPPGSSPYASNVVAADFVNAAGHDFHLSASSGLIGQGANLTTSYTTDVDGDTWPASGAWDIGFDRYVAAGGFADIAGAGAAQATGAAGLAVDVALAGVGVALASGAAGTAVDVALSALGIAVANAAAGGVITVSIAAAGLAQASALAGLSADVLLQASGAATAAGNAQLAATLSALASGAAQASGAATLEGGAVGDIAGTGVAQASGAALLSIIVALAAPGVAQASGTATIEGAPVADIAGTGAAQATASATVSATVTLTAAGFVQAMGAGTLAVQVPLAAFGTALATGAATISGGVVVLPDLPQPRRAVLDRVLVVSEASRLLAIPHDSRVLRI